MSDNKQRNIIEINGQKYDAITGSLIHDDDKKSEQIKSAAPTKQALSNGAVLDGFVRRPITNNPKPQSSETSVVKQLNSDRSVQKAVRIPQKSKTLMRPAVKKPKHQAPTEAVAKTPIVSPVPYNRLRRAKQVSKSAIITRFSQGSGRSSVTKRIADIPVAVKNNSEHDGIFDQFDQAIQDATSHLETYVDDKVGVKKSRKFAFATASLSAILVCSFLVYQAVPAVKIKVAGSKAGFSASLPSYSPAGFGLSSDVVADSGEVSLAYNSRTDAKSYKITQTPSDWNSQTLLNNFVLATGKTYQTYPNNGKTIYIFNDSNATWVDGGIWYRLEGNASLTSDQLQRIVNGL